MAVLLPPKLPPSAVVCQRMLMDANGRQKAKTPHLRGVNVLQRTSMMVQMVELGTPEYGS